MCQSFVYDVYSICMSFVRHVYIMHVDSYIVCVMCIACVQVVQMEPQMNPDDYKATRAAKDPARFAVCLTRPKAARKGVRDCVPTIQGCDMLSFKIDKVRHGAGILVSATGSRCIWINIYI